ncbi:MAG TPA: hypothetical protein VIH99_11045 [Bdellovibrionota bacterium]|jgi:hypothetical protein
MKKKNQKTGDYSLAHVLYQKLGNDWYAFTEKDGDCFMTKVDAEVAEATAPSAAQEDDQRQTRKRSRAA